VVVEVHHFRPTVERDELFITDAVETGVGVFSLHVFVVSDGLLLELGDRGLAILDRGHTGLAAVAQLLDH